MRKEPAEHSMTLNDAVKAVRRYWWLPCACALLGAVSLLVMSKLTVPKFTASARVFVSVASSKGASDLSQGATFVQSQVASYADLVSSPFLLDPVAKKLRIEGGGKSLSEVVSGSSSKETVIITIRASDPDAMRSAEIVDAVADELGTAVRQLAPRDAEGRPMVQVVTVSRSGPPAVPSLPKTSQNTLMGLVAGALFGTVLAIAITFVRPLRRADKKPGAHAADRQFSTRGADLAEDDDDSESGHRGVTAGAARSRTPRPRTASTRTNPSRAAEPAPPPATRSAMGTQPLGARRPGWRN